ncbi:MAG: hypothetical protein EA360_01240 [Balneolaceae bacterium]|nr:MAG: hypothetical protein EA360_01240 [Balneolaceae bacterium]
MKNRKFSSASRRKKNENCSLFSICEDFKYAITKIQGKRTVFQRPCILKKKMENCDESGKKEEQVKNLEEA